MGVLISTSNHYIYTTAGPSAWSTDAATISDSYLIHFHIKKGLESNLTMSDIVHYFPLL